MLRVRAAFAWAGMVAGLLLLGAGAIALLAALALAAALLIPPLAVIGAGLVLVWLAADDLGLRR